MTRSIDLDDYSTETLEVICYDLLTLLDADHPADPSEIRRIYDEIYDHLGERDDRDDSD